MRNKFSSNLLQKGLISLAAASVLATGAMAVSLSTTTAGYTFDVSKTVTAKGTLLYGTVTLINDSDVVDTLNGSASVPTITLNSLNGVICAGKYTDGCPTSTSSAVLTVDSTPTAAQGGFNKGLGFFTIDYSSAKVGVDTLTTTATVKGTSLDTGTEVTIVLENQTKDITVTEAPNDAVALGVASIIPATSHTNSVTGIYDSNSTSHTNETNASILAGDSFKMTLKAYTNANGGSSNFTENQNGEVSVTLTYDSDGDFDATDETTELSIDLTGTMVNGVAEITVPAETVTKSGHYSIYASSETKNATADSDYLAETTDGVLSQLKTKTEYLTVVGLDASALDVSLWRPFILALGSETQNELNVSVVDKYGNLASTTSSAITFDVEASTGKIFNNSNTKSSQSMLAGTVSTPIAITGYSSTTAADVPVSPDSPKTTATLTVTPKSGITADAVTIDLDLYLYGLVAMQSVASTDGLAQDGNYTAGTVATSTTGVLTNVEANATQFVVVHKFDTNASALIKNPSEFNLSRVVTGETGAFPSTYVSLSAVPDMNHTFLAEKSAIISVYLKTSDGNVSDTITTTPLLTVDNVDANSSPLSFKTAITGARMIAEVTSIDGNIEIAPYDYATNKGIGINGVDMNETNVTVLPGTINTFAIGQYSQNTNEAKLLGKSEIFTEYTTIEAHGSTTSSVKDSTDNRATVYIVGESNTTTLTDSKSDGNISSVYVIRLTDAYANKLTTRTDDVTMKSTSVDGELAVSQVTGSSYSTSGHTLPINDGGLVIDYGSTGTDHLKFTLQEGFTTLSKEIEVVSMDKSQTLSTLTLETISDYVLKNSSIVVNIEALKSNLAAYSFENDAEKVLSLTISNPNLVEIYEGNTSSDVSNGYPNSGILQNGGDVNDTTAITAKTDGKTILFLNAKNSEGDLTITLKNKAGTVSASKTLHILGSTADFPSPISTISLSETSINVTAGGTTDLTLTLTKESGDVAGNEEVTISSDSTGVASVPASVITDENGVATLTVTAGTVVGSANITLTAGGVSEIVTVSTGAAPTMVVASNEASLQVGIQTSIAVGYNAGTPTVATSDSTVATASYSGGSVIITGVIDGTATITVTDTDGTVQTIAVTVEAAVAPADLTDTTKVTDNDGVINTDGQIVMSDVEAVISFLNAFNSDDETLAANTTVAGLTATTLGTTTFFKENGKSIFAINYSTSNGATTITISWLDTATARAVEPDYVVTITDGDQTLELPIVKGDSTPTETAMTPALVAGWNLLGNASNASQTVAKTGISITWTFDGAWTQDGDIPAGQGFWAKADADIAGYEFANSGDGTSMPTFTAGTWSLMAATMSETLADVLASKTDATIVWSFTDSTWSSDGATTIEAGQGYWVK